MTSLPDRLPVLSRGAQAPGSGKVCAEQAVNWLNSGRLILDNETDHPDCVQPVLNSLAIACNDALPGNRRGEMWPLILRQPGTAHPEMEPKLSTDLAIFICHWVVENWPVPDIDPVTREALEAASACLAEPSEANSARAARAAGAAGAAEAAGAAWAARADGHLALLAAAQDECERLTGHVPAPADPSRLERLCELVGTE